MPIGAAGEKFLKFLPCQWVGDREYGIGGRGYGGYGIEGRAVGGWTDRRAGKAFCIKMKVVGSSLSGKGMVSIKGVSKKRAST